MALLMALLCGASMAQSSSQQTPTADISSHPLRSVNGNVDPVQKADVNEPIDEQRQMRQLNAAMHKSMVSDTDKLLKLVTELNAEISNTKPDALTPEQLRKIAAIEKLARSVRDEMRTSLEGTVKIPSVLPDLPGPRP